tara:strand:- start:611 stop:1417 length:807 start_codon:yes stop_codon:yes gene_type:complete
MYATFYSLNGKDIIEIILVWGLILGTLLSYVPQYYRIYKIKTVKGISESMLIFGIFSSYTNVLGSVQENLKNIVQCRGYDCYNFYIPITQLFSPFLCAIVFYAFYLYYYIYSLNSDLIEKLYNKEYYLKNNAPIKRAWFNLFLGISIVLYTVLVCVYQDYNFNDNSGKSLNILSTVLSLIMWLPQIHTTYVLKNNHSLSLIALSIHALGCLITVIYQSVFIHQPLWVILCYIVGFISETTIVLMCLYYKKQKNKDRKDILHKTLINKV